MLDAGMVIGFRFAPNFAGRFVDGDAPKVHVTSAVAHVIEIGAIGRPDRVPIHRRAGSDLDHVATLTRNRRDTAFSFGNAPIGDASAVGRPARLDRVVRRDKSLHTRGNIDRPKLDSRP